MKKGNGIKQTFTPHPKGGFDLTLTCEKCGEPITHENDYGMFCDNECNLEESIEAKKKVDKIMDTMEKIFNKW